MKHLVSWKHPESDCDGVWLLSEEEMKKGDMYARLNEVEIEAVREYPDHFNLFRVIVAGGRSFQDYARLEAALDYLLSGKVKDHVIVIVSGTARGADQLGERYARARGHVIDRYPANWDAHGKRAGYLRNSEMADNADAVVLFWDGQSKGTGHMLNIAVEKGLDHRVEIYT